MFRTIPALGKILLCGTAVAVPFAVCRLGERRPFTVMRPTRPTPTSATRPTRLTLPQSIPVFELRADPTISPRDETLREVSAPTPDAHVYVDDEARSEGRWSERSVSFVGDDGTRYDLIETSDGSTSLHDYDSHTGRLVQVRCWGPGGQPIRHLFYDKTGSLVERPS